jgi:hypothetical protein
MDQAQGLVAPPQGFWLSPGNLATKAWRPHNNVALLHIRPALTVCAISVFQSYEMSFRLDAAPPWTVEETPSCFIVRDSNGQALN